jgi:uncharacterized protein
MRRSLPTATFVIAALTMAAAGHAPAQESASSVPVEFAAGGDLIRGRFFAAAGPAPLATLVLIPGFGGAATDVLGLGERLSERDVNVLVFNNRGVRDSGGTLTYANALDDALAALDWLRTPGVRARFHVDPDAVVLGGYSFGGAVAILHAARDPRVGRVLAIAGADHSVYARRMREEHGYRDALRGVLEGTRAPGGPVRFDPDALLDEIAANESAYAHPPHAARFAGRPVLLIGGWNDGTCPFEREVLPLYRALQASAGSDPSIVAYPDGHAFGDSRERMAEDVHAWIVRTTPRGAPGRTAIAAAAATGWR